MKAKILGRKMIIIIIQILFKPRRGPSNEPVVLIILYYIGVRNIQVGLTMVQFTEYILCIVKCAGKFRTFSMVD